MNLSNKLTLSRIGLTFVMMGFLFGAGVAAKAAACAVFLLACLTDFLDGWVARRRNEISDFGKLMDPIADKVLIVGAFLSFVELHLVPAWMVVVIIIREFLITGLRFFAARKGMVLAAESAGKHKTVSQMITVFVVLLFLAVRETMSAASSWSQELQAAFRVIILFLMSVTVTLTIFSGLSYVWQNRRLMRGL